MSILIYKVHPRYFTYYVNEDVWGTVLLTRNLLSNTEQIKNIFYSLTETEDIDNVFYENPHIQLEGSYRDVIRDITTIQRLSGVIEYLSWEYFKTQPGPLKQPLPKPDKDKMIELCDKTLKSSSYLTPLEKLCVADCLLLYNELTIPKHISARVEINANT